ncbi:hypothetical protein F2Q70_00013255 [Brassica cretica]|uniref:Protein DETOXIFICATION n=1 Tax=Brassica cretica TaxID=69181 RepID=A0A8S9MED6_BRACR|nr:hypothetical protein F2Q70_00013255 [Brassica cretica]
MGSAVETLCGQAHGAHRYDMLGIYLQRATIVLALVGLPMTLLYTFSYPILVLLGEPKTVSYMGSLYIVGLIPQIFAYAVNFTAQKFLQAQSVVTPSAYISAAALLLQISLTYITVYVMGLGLMGIAYVLTICWWVIVGAQTLYITKSQRFRHTWTGLSWRSFQGLWSFFKLSAGSAVMICLEMWYSQILVLLAGLLKDPALSLDSLSICMSISALSFMVSVGFNAAASVRTSNELGAANPKSALFSTWTATVVSFIISFAEALAVMAARDYISYIFTSDPEVAKAVSDLCPFLAVTVILNGIQPVLSGVAVGCGWQAFVAYVNVGCYYIVGIPVGCILGFTFNFQAKGIWTGMIGGTLMQTLILLYVTYRTDWDKEILLLLPVKLSDIHLFAAEQFEEPSFSRSDEPLVKFQPLWFSCDVVVVHNLFRVVLRQFERVKVMVLEMKMVLGYLLSPGYEGPSRTLNKCSSWVLLVSGFPLCLCMVKQYNEALWFGSRHREPVVQMRS